MAQKAGQQDWGWAAALEAEQQQLEPGWAGASEEKRQSPAQAPVPEGERQPHQAEGADPEWGWGGFWHWQAGIPSLGKLNPAPDPVALGAPPGAFEQPDEADAA